jgi:hypothetical protein
MTRRIVSADGKRRVEIAPDQIGLFRFIEDTDIWTDDYAVPAPVWTPTYFSGLYETAEAAEVDARAILPWLNDLNPN